ncbi:hypothetical protein ES703_26928 [subsurface metagenome]
MEPQQTDKLAEESSWLNKCPVCKAGSLSLATEKRRFGLGAKQKAICGCGAVFRRRGDVYELETGGDYSSPTWQEYGRHFLSSREWASIAQGGMSDAKLAQHRWEREEERRQREEGSRQRELETLQQHREADIEVARRSVREGTLRLRIPGAVAPIIFKKGEELRLVLPGVSLLQPRAVRHGSYGGGSIRIAKGIRIGGGQFRAESSEELRNIDRGTLALTDKRFVFIGGKRTINVPLGKILSVEPHRSLWPPALGIALHRTGKQKTEYFTNWPRAEISISVDDRTHEVQLDRTLLADIITGLVAQTE